MIARQSQRSLTSTRPTRARCAPTLSTWLVSLVPLAAPANVHPSHAPADHQGPVLSSSEIVRGAMLLQFTHADGGLLLKSPGRGALEIAGVDHVWFPAEAHLVNGAVIVSTSIVQQPTAVRYNWLDLAAAALFNSVGLPVDPFHTDK